MFRRRFLVFGVAATLAACGGGGGAAAPPVAGTTPAPGPTPTAGPASAARASFSITIPKKAGSARGRSPRTIPSGTQSIRFTLVKTDATTSTPVPSPLYPLTPTSPGCVDNGTTITCTLQVAAPVGTDIFVADVYATTDGSGTKLGSGTVRIAVADNAVNTASLSLFGPVAKVVLSSDDIAHDGSPVLAINFLVALPNISLPGTTEIVPTSARIFVVALDAQGNQIIAPDTFDTPVTLTIARYVPTPSDRGRRPQIATPVQSLASLTVQYAFPQNGVTSASTGAGNASIPVLSPADKTVITALGGPLEGDLVVNASVNGTVQASQLLFLTLPSVCPPGQVGTPPFACAPPTPTPAPLAWQNPGNSPNFTPASNGTNAAVDAVLNTASSFTGYTLQLNTNGIARTVTIDATACYPAIVEVVPATWPSPTPSPLPSPAQGPTPTPNPAAYVLHLESINPSVTFYWGQTAPAIHCTVTGADDASHQANLDFNFTQGNVTVQGRTHR